MFGPHRQSEEQKARTEESLKTALQTGYLFAPFRRQVIHDPSVDQWREECRKRSWPIIYVNPITRTRKGKGHANISLFLWSIGGYDWLSKEGKARIRTLAAGFDIPECYRNCPKTYFQIRGAGSECYFHDVSIETAKCIAEELVEIVFDFTSLSNDPKKVEVDWF